MKRKLSPWCKEVKKTLIDRDMSVTELCGEVGMCRNYVTTTINGRMYAPAAEVVAHTGEWTYAICNCRRRNYFYGPAQLGRWYRKG